MMTTADMKNRNLKTGIGYEKKDVDTFLEEIIASYEELYRSNIELNDKVNSLNEGLQHYKTIEASLQKTLILAERTAEETVNEAKEKAKQIEEEAKGNTGKIALEAKKELDAIVEKTSELVETYNNIKAKMKDELSKQMTELDNNQITFDPSKYAVELSNPVTESTVSDAPVQTEVKNETKNSTSTQAEVKMDSFTSTSAQPETKTETVESTPVQPEVIQTETIQKEIPQPAAAKFLRNQTPEPKVESVESIPEVKEEPKVEPILETKEEPKKEEKSNVFNLNLGGGSASTTTEETKTTESENKLGINLGTSSQKEEQEEIQDNNYDDSEDDSYEFEVEDSAFRSKRNANGQMLIGNDDEESGFEFLSEL